MDAPSGGTIHSNWVCTPFAVGNKDDGSGVGGCASVLDKKEGFRGNKASILITIVFE